MIVARASTPETRAPFLLRRALPGLLLVVVSAALLAPAAAGAVPLQLPDGWTFTASGLRQLPDTADTRAFCKGPGGSVYEVALGTKITGNAVMARIRISDGKVIRSWDGMPKEDATEFAKQVKQICNANK